MSRFSLKTLADYTRQATEGILKGWQRTKKWFFYPFSPKAIPEKPPLTPQQKKSSSPSLRILLFALSFIIS
jgi:hypothetical protein